MARLFDPEVISRIKSYEIRARRVVQGFLIGIHKSPTFGMSMEFKQHREYVQGDDIRHLDWKVYAKTDKYFIKQYESETNLACQIVLDCSESMSFKDGGPMSKFEYGATAAVSLAYLLLTQRDAVGFTFFDEKVRTYIPAQATFSQFHAAIKVIENITPGAKTMTGSALMAVGNSFKRRSMVIIISDFLDDIEPIELGLNRLHFDGHEVLAVHISDPYEVTFPYSGPAVIEGMEATGNLRCDPSDYRELYLERRSAHLARLRHVCRNLRFDIAEMVTTTPLDEALAELFLLRRHTAVR